MKHIIEQWEEKAYDSALWDFYFRDMKVGVLDIETTGLNPARNKFILGCFHDISNSLLHQVLAQSRAEEDEALEEYMKLIDDMDVVVTFNGRHFDMPFIARRYGNVYHPLPYDLDLYQVLDKYSDLRKLLPNLKQKTVEDYMGFWHTRTDDISGKESVDLYNRYEATGDTKAEEKILLHNSDDVRQLTRLTKAITKSDFHRAMFHLGFPVKCGTHLLTVTEIKPAGELLTITGRQFRNPVNYMGFELNGAPVETSFRGDSFTIRMPLIRRQGLAIIDLAQTGFAEGDLSKYPMCREGFLVIHDGREMKYREINDFVITFIKSFFETEVDS